MNRSNAITVDILLFLLGFAILGSWFMTSDFIYNLHEDGHLMMAKSKGVHAFRSDQNAVTMPRREFESLDMHDREAILLAGYNAEWWFFVGSGTAALIVGAFLFRLLTFHLETFFIGMLMRNMVYNWTHAMQSTDFDRIPWIEPIEFHVFLLFGMFLVFAPMTLLYITHYRKLKVDSKSREYSATRSNTSKTSL